MSQSVKKVRTTRNLAKWYAVIGGSILSVFLLAMGLGTFIPRTPAPPTPTITPAPPAPSFIEIRTKMSSMTKAQWDQYSTSLIGLAVNDWTGWVQDVQGNATNGYELSIDMDPPGVLLSVFDVVFSIPDDLALRLQKDSLVTFSGKIKSVRNILGSAQVDLIDVSVVP